MQMYNMKIIHEMVKFLWNFIGTHHFQSSNTKFLFQVTTMIFKEKISQPQERSQSNSYIKISKSNVKVQNTGPWTAWANIVDPDQTAPSGAVWWRSTLFAILSAIITHHQNSSIYYSNFKIQELQ